MRVGLLADVHGNSDALRAVDEDARAAGVDRLIVAGDLVGYYYDVAGVLEVLDTWDRIVVRGNHEDLLADWRAGIGHEEVQRRYGSGLAAACEQLDDAALTALTALPHPVRTVVAGRRVTICHGTPNDIDAYVYPDADEVARAQLLDAAEEPDLVVHGHTHHPVTWAAAGTRVVNPGSVGQPRDRIPGACWALWDTDADEVELRRVAYDVDRLVRECRRRDAGLPYLADVLTRTS